MKQYLVIVVTLTLIANSQCGLIDGLFGKVKDTTSSIKQNIGGAFLYGKSLVFGSETNETGRTITKPGIIGTISLKIHDVSSAIRDEVTNVFSMFDKNQNGEKGVVGRMIDRVKNRVVKIKGFFFGDTLSQIEDPSHLTKPPDTLDKDTASLCKKVRQYFLKNNTSTNSRIRNTIFSLQDAINKIRNNITKTKDSDSEKNQEVDGSDLIDIRASATNLAGGLQDDFVNGIDAAYDKVEDGFEKGRDQAIVTVSTLKEKSNDFIESQGNNLQNNYNKLDDKSKKFRSDVDKSINDFASRLKDESNKALDNGKRMYLK